MPVYWRRSKVHRKNCSKISTWNKHRNDSKLRSDVQCDAYLQSLLLERHAADRCSTLVSHRTQGCVEQQYYNPEEQPDKDVEVPDDS